MTMHEPDMENEIIDLALKYADELMRYLDIRKAKIEQNQFENFHQENLENIDSGVSGQLLYLIELYKKTADIIYLNQIDDWIELLLIYFDKNPTNDYSLYMGRGGFIYLLIKRYSISKERRFIEEGLKLIQPANQWYLTSEFTTDYFYNGKAGTILLMIDLYNLTGEQSLLSYIDEFIRKIISNAKISNNGIFWIAEYEYNIKPSCGFAFGGSGIKYVFEKLTEFCRSHSLDFMIDGIQFYADSCWISDYVNWGAYEREISDEGTLKNYKYLYSNENSRFFKPDDCWSWAFGAIGNIDVLKSPVPREDILINILDNKLINLDKDQFYLFDGLAGLGLFLHNLPFKSEYFNGKLEEIKRHILNYSINLEIENGLMHGKVGCVYFLLKMIGYEKDTGDILNYKISAPSSTSDPHIPIDYVDTLKETLIKNYPRTISLLENVAPDILTQFLEKCSAGLFKSVELLSNFPAYITSCFKSISPISADSRIMDVFLLEKRKLDMLEVSKKSNLHAYIESLMFQDKILTLLNKSDEWLLEQTIQINQNVVFIRTKWDWFFQENYFTVRDETIKDIEYFNLKNPAKEYSYLLQIFGNSKVLEFPLLSGLDLLINAFTEPRKVREVVDYSQQFVASLPESEWRKLTSRQLLHKSVHSVNDVISELEWITLKQIKPLIYSNLLVFR